MKSKLKDVYQLLEEADGNALLVLQQIVKDGKITNDFQLYVLARLLTIKNKHGEVGNLFQNIATDTSLIKDIRNWDAADLIKEVDELIFLDIDATKKNLPINLDLVINLDNDELCIESENLLGFDEQLKYEVRFIGVGAISQKGLATSCLKGTGRVIIKTQGNPIVLESPCVVDPDAVVCWTGNRDPRIKTDVSWKTFLGQSSGESYQFDFDWKGATVIVQPCERKRSTPPQRRGTGIID